MWRSTASKMSGGIVVALTVGALLSAPTAAADDTVADLVENTGAAEKPFWSYLYDHGFGYLPSARVKTDGNLVCVNREAGVPDSRIVELLERRGFAPNEAQAILDATENVNIADPTCTDSTSE